MVGFSVLFFVFVGGRLGGGNETRTARAGVRQSTVANRAIALQRGNPIEPGLSRAEEIECRYLRQSKGKSGIEDKQIQPSIDFSLFHIKEKKRRNQNRYQKVKYKKKIKIKINQTKKSKTRQHQAGFSTAMNGRENGREKRITWEKGREKKTSV